MRVLKLTIAYDGTRFVGWQRQAEGESIQGLLEQALARFTGTAVVVHGAGRTDAGVHALAQVATAEIATTHDAGALQRGLNASLPPDIRVTGVEDAAFGFHARFKATSKTYRYVIDNRSVPSPFDRAYSWHIPEPLNAAAMRDAARGLVGTHDFACFRSAGSDVTTTVRTVTRSEVLIAPHEIPGVDHSEARYRIVYEVSGDGFLRHMVRAIAGTLVSVGRGARPASSMAALLADGGRAQAGQTAPAQGLFLVRVDYD